MKDPLFLLVQKLLQLNKIPFDKNELEFQIASHPSYPSLHAITGVLDHFNIENIALDVEINEEILSQLPKVFLAQLHAGTHTKEFAVVENIGLEYQVTGNNKQRKKISLNEFSKHFTGILVAVEKEENHHEKETINSKQLNTVLAVTTLCLFLTSIVYSSPKISSIMFFILALIGTFVSFSIYKQESGEESILGNAFCSSQNDKTSCEAVLTSKGATLFKNFKLSDLSMTYFVGLSLATFLTILLKTNLSTVFAISFIALPITVYSIYYQYKVVKKWCLLCLSIIAVLWLQSIVGAFNFSSLLMPSIDSLFITALAFSCALVSWRFLTQLLNTKNLYKSTKVSYFKFKKNFNLFNTLLMQSKAIDTTISNCSEITLGNKSSQLEITIITNPFCGHCRTVHTLVEDILKSYAEIVNIKIRFNINSKNKDSDPVIVTSRLLELFHSKGPAISLDAMHDIYAGELTENWINKWGNCSDLNSYIKILDTQSEWCKDNAINFTPEILINGRSFPKAYDRSDLIYFIDELEENSCQESKSTLSFT